MKYSAFAIPDKLATTQVTFLLIAFLSLISCGGIVPRIGPEPLQYLNDRYNPWLGKTKDQRMQGVGVPARCSAISTGGEMCEWRQSGHTKLRQFVDPEKTATEKIKRRQRRERVRDYKEESPWENRVQFVYDRTGTAVGWKYFDSQEDKVIRSSSDSQP